MTTDADLELLRRARDDIARLTAENLSLKERWYAANRVNRRLEATVARVEALCDRNTGGLLAVEVVRAALQPRGER